MTLHTGNEITNIGVEPSRYWEILAQTDLILGSDATQDSIVRKS